VSDKARTVIKNFWLWFLIVVGLFGAFLLVAVSRQIETLMGGMLGPGGTASKVVAPGKPVVPGP